MGMRYVAWVALATMAGCTTEPLLAKTETPDPVAIAWAALSMEPESAPRVHWIEGCATSVPEDFDGENRVGLKDAAGCIVYDMGVDGWLEVREAAKPSDSALVRAMISWRNWLTTSNPNNGPVPDGSVDARAALVAVGL